MVQRRNSVAAYHSVIEDGTAQAHREHICTVLFNLDYYDEEGHFVKHRAATTDQIAEASGLTTAQVSKRIKELRNEGKIVETDIEGRSNSGRKCAVWALVNPQNAA